MKKKTAITRAHARTNAEACELLARFRSLNAVRRQAVLAWTDLLTRLQPQDTNRKPLSARAARQLAQLKMEWNDIQNRVTLRETRRLQEHGRYTKAEQRRLDALMREMEAVKGGAR